MSGASTVPGTTVRVILPGIVEPSGLIVQEAPGADPAVGELLVAVEATGISYAEQAMRHGRHFGQPTFPFTPGYDLIGTVIRVTASPMLHRAARVERGQTILLFGANGGVGAS